MSVRERLTIADLAHIPDPVDDTRYELIDGELYVSTQPSWEHQFTMGRVGYALARWNEEAALGIILPAPGVIFAEDEAVAPDLVWVRRDRFARLVGDDHKLHAAPDLVVEVLSPGRRNRERDLEVKLDLYSRRGVEEYWIADWMDRTVQVHRRREARLRLELTLRQGDRLTSPLLPGFEADVGELFPPPT